MRTLASQVALMRERGFDAAADRAGDRGDRHDDYQGRTRRRAHQAGMGAFGARAAHDVADLRAAIDGERPTRCSSTA